MIQPLNHGAIGGTDILGHSVEIRATFSARG